ncbi:MAG: hypothetical protein P9C36_10350 [Defluviicoccus sp.]|nr:hypothetical protein [Defluviicoccus sp.]MDG4593011.1 hypothetical protein [Defluviicoccus sp.]
MTKILSIGIKTYILDDPFSFLEVQPAMPVFMGYERDIFRRIARRGCAAMVPIANITAGVLLANSKFPSASIAFTVALGLAFMLAHLERTPNPA